MSLDSVVTVNISKSGKPATRAGFGTPLIMAYHSVTAKRLALYSSIKALTDDGFPLTHPAVRVAQKLFSQNPAPSQIMVGKRTVGTTQIIIFTPKVLTQGYHYIFNVVDYLGAVTAIDYTVPGSATAATISTAIVALLGSVAHVTAATVSTTGFSLTSTTAGDLFNLTALPNPDDLNIKNTSTDPGIAADLQAVYNIDSVSWYGILFDSTSKAEAVAAAAWVETVRKLAGINSSDSEIADNAITNDVFSTLKGSTYARTYGMFCASELHSYTAAGWMGSRFPSNPGKATWSYVTIAGTPIDTLKDGQVANISGTQGLGLGKNGNVYINLAGSGSTQQGITFAGEFIDITVGTDWLHARLQERLVGAIQNASNSGSKIPYTDKGAQILVGLTYAQLQQAQSPDFNLLATDPAPVVNCPLVKDQDPGDRALRSFPGMTFTATYAGAIHSLIMNGTISI